MRIAYLDCSTGISGDMTLGALIDAGVDARPIHQAVGTLGIEDVRVDVRTVVKGGFRATKVDVIHPPQHAHRHLNDIRQLIERAEMTVRQRDLALRIFTAVAEAEANVHGLPIEKVHFHEVGAIDSIVDILGAAIGFDLLGADEIVCSPLPPGRGQIRIAHGVCTVPAPGTAELLKGIPLADVPVEAELTTPTGAAIVKMVADRFGPLPAMTIERVGYGAGTMDLPGRANLLRLFVGTTQPPADQDVVVLLETNLDDVSPEFIGYAKRRLLEAGALDVYTTAIQMKKDRPGTIVSVLARPADADALESLMFSETGTFGIRRQRIERSVRTREPVSVQTLWGPVAGKLGWRGIDRVFTPEFEDCARIAEKHHVPLREVYRAALAAFTAGESTVAAPPSIPSENLQPPAGCVHDHDHDHDHGAHHHHDHG